MLLGSLSLSKRPLAFSGFNSTMSSSPPPSVVQALFTQHNIEWDGYDTAGQGSRQTHHIGFQLANNASQPHGCSHNKPSQA
jgi:hypothetical protein